MTEEINGVEISHAEEGGGKVMIRMTGKPDERVRKELYQAGFSWDGLLMAWTAPNTPLNLKAARRMAEEGM